MFDAAAFDVPRGIQAAVDLSGEMAVLLRMRAVVMVEGDVEGREVRAVFGVHAFDERLGLDALATRAQHDRRAVGVIGADVDALVPAQSLKACPDVGLDVFDEVPQMDRPVGVGQGAGDEDAAWRGHGGILHVPFGPAFRLITHDG